MHLSGREDAPRAVPQPTIARTPIPVCRGNIRNGSGDRDRLSRQYGRQRETYSQHEARAHAHEASAGAAREIFSARRAPNEGAYEFATSLSQSSSRLTRYALRLMDLNLMPSFIAFCATAPRVRRNFFAACVAESLAFARLRKLLTSSFDHADTLLRLLLAIDPPARKNTHHTRGPSRMESRTIIPFTGYRMLTVTSHRAGN